jgi:hypothetical protein
LGERKNLRARGREAAAAPGSPARAEAARTPRQSRRGFRPVAALFSGIAQPPRIAYRHDMKSIATAFVRGAPLAAALTLAAASLAPAEEPTAFELIKQGNQYVGVQSKDKVVQIRSEKSIGTLTPNIWYIVYYDPDATFKAMEVKFGAGKKLKVARPWRVIERGLGEDKVLESSKLKTDSDKAIKIACDEPLLKSLQLRATQLWLQRGDEGPVWRVRLWASKLKNPADDVDIGDVYISAADGKVIRTNLHIDRVD